MGHGRRPILSAAGAVEDMGPLALKVERRGDAADAGRFHRAPVLRLSCFCRDVTPPSRAAVPAWFLVRMRTHPAGTSSFSPASGQPPDSGRAQAGTKHARLGPFAGQGEQPAAPRLDLRPGGGDVGEPTPECLPLDIPNLRSHEIRTSSVGASAARQVAMRLDFPESVAPETSQCGSWLSR